MKTIQYFSDDYLEHCKKMKPDEIVRFLEDFSRLHSENINTSGNSNGNKSRLISLKIPEPMLTIFKTKARLEGKKYQTQIKILMEKWIKNI